MGAPAPDSALEALIEAARRGDSSAMESLLARIQPDVFRICWAACGSMDIAEESCQEALAVICGSLRRVRHPARFWGWAATIARRAAVHRARHEARRRVPPDSGMATPRPTREETAARLADIASALPRLRPEFKQIVELRGIMGMEYDAIATRLEITPENARQRYSRAIEELRRWVGTER